MLSKALGIAPTAELTDKTLERKARAVTLAGLTTLQTLLAALHRYKKALLEFSSRCRKEAWPQAPIGRTVPPGVSVHQLGIFLISLKGRDAVNEYFSESKVSTDVIDLDRQVTIAREIAAKYSV